MTWSMKCMSTQLSLRKWYMKDVFKRLVLALTCILLHMKESALSSNVTISHPFKPSGYH